MGVTLPKSLRFWLYSLIVILSSAPLVFYLVSFLSSDTELLFPVLGYAVSASLFFSVIYFVSRRVMEREQKERLKKAIIEVMSEMQLDRQSKSKSEETP